MEEDETDYLLENLLFEEEQWVEIAILEHEASVELISNAMLELAFHISPCGLGFVPE